MKTAYGKIIGVLLALALICVSAWSAFAADFTDAGKIGEAYRTAVSEMTRRGVLNGYPDGSFQPGGTLTREEGAKIVTYMVLGSDAETLRVPVPYEP